MGQPLITVSALAHLQSFWGCLISLVTVSAHAQLARLTYWDDCAGTNSLSLRWQISRFIPCPPVIIAHCATWGRPFLLGTPLEWNDRGFVLRQTRLSSCHLRLISKAMLSGLSFRYTNCVLSSESLLSSDDSCDPTTSCRSLTWQGTPLTCTNCRLIISNTPHSKLVHTLGAWGLNPHYVSNPISSLCVAWSHGPCQPVLLQAKHRPLASYYTSRLLLGSSIVSWFWSFL